MPSTNTILVVDDEDSLRISLTLILERAGYAVNAAAHARDALRYVQARAYDLVFLDLQMPDMDGMTLLAEIHRLCPELPVLILTAHATLESAIEAVRHGARDYLLKPVDPPRILARVREVLSEQAQPARRREIVGQIQDLLSQLRQFDGPDMPPATLIATVPPTDPARFLRRGAFTLDLHTRHCTMGDKFVELTPTTFDYLVTLVRHAPNPVLYRTLVKESQGYDLTQVEAEEMARWRIHELRKALEPNMQHPRYVLTVRGTGYRFVP
ncbi:MAG: response regulator transcription factor [Chloroflexi bacterium]|nr:response regulator transcription factor [Chloroflexota bacterium]